MARVFLIYLGQKYKTLNVLNELGLSWKSVEKTFCPRFNRSSLLFDRSSQAESHKYFYSHSIPTLHITHTLWASLNKTNLFWSWFSNITIRVLNTLVPKSLEPNKYNEDYNFLLVCLKSFRFLFCHSVSFLILESWRCLQKRKE